MATNNQLLNCPHLRFPGFSDEWQQTTLGELLEFFPTNSFSWDKLTYSSGNIYNVHYGLIHKGLPIICSPTFLRLPYIGEEMDTEECSFCKSGDLVIADASEDTYDVGKAIELVDCDKVKVLAGLHTIHARSSMDKTVIGFKGYLFASNNLREQIKRVAQGTKVYSISSKLISPLRLSLPTLPEQEKIASFLSLLDERIEVQRQTIKERKNQKKALLSQIFSQALRFPGFSDEWTPCIIRDFGEVITGGTPPTLDSLNYNPPKYLWASPSDLGNAKYLHKTKTLISEKGLSIVRSLPKGSILVTCIGLIGKMGIATEEMTSNQQINAVIVSDVFSNEYVYYAIYSKAYSFQKMASTQVVPILSKREFEKLPNSYPSLPEQERIANFLSLIDERIEVEEQLLQKYEEQKRYLLRKMFV